MKIRIYRKNIWLKFDFWQSLFFYALGPAYYLYAIMQYGTANIFGVLFSFLLATYILLASGRFWYYVIFTENELVLKNALYRCTKHFPFKEILGYCLRPDTVHKSISEDCRTAHAGTAENH